MEQNPIPRAISLRNSTKSSAYKLPIVPKITNPTKIKQKTGRYILIPY